MTPHLNEVVERIRHGDGVIAVQDDALREYVGAFVRQDPGGEDPPRPVLAWDADDGLRACSDYADDLPDCPTIDETLSFAKRYRGGVIVVIDCAGVDLAANPRGLRKRLKEVADRTLVNPHLLVVLTTPRPLPAAIGGAIHWIGEAPDESAHALPEAPAVVSRNSYSEIQDLVAFDTEEWQKKLSAMPSQEVREIVKAGAYRDALDRVNELRKSIKDRFARKEEIVDSIFAATIAQVPAVLIGPPGTAKSNLIRSVCEGLGLLGQSHESNDQAGRRQYFEYLLTRYTTPEEIFGPIHVQDLIDKQVYRRVTTGYLPECQIAFLDEIFKAGSAIVNTLLTILNERIFYNAGQAFRIPMMMVFAASNEAPTDEAMTALYDRFPIRINCPPVEVDHLDKLMTLSWEQAFDRQFSVDRMIVPRCSCSNDLRLLGHVMRIAYGGRSPADSRRAGSFDFGAEFLRAFRSLRGDFGISDRTLGPLLAMARSYALLKGKSGLSIDELDVFRHVSWEAGGTGELDRIVSNIKRGVRI